jgi:anaerobic ribonucleoside-triphosphate reductase activating protein
MLKYQEVLVGFSEVPEEIALCINISGCPIHCEGCHSPHLWENTGENLTEESLNNLVCSNPGITCVAFMGGDGEPEEIFKLAKWVKDNTRLKVCWYKGTYLYTHFRGNYDMFLYFDYIKSGAYIKRRGGLDNPNTNQRFYKITSSLISEFAEGKICTPHFEDLTYKFRNNEADNKSKSAN